MNTTPATYTLDLRRTFAAPVELVYAAWTDFKQVALWFGCGDRNITKAQGEVHVGGRYRVEGVSPQGPFVLEGTYREVTPRQRLVFTWEWQTGPFADDKDMVVTVEFRPIGAKTEVHLVHERLASEAARAAHTSGWEVSLQRIAEIFGS